MIGSLPSGLEAVIWCYACIAMRLGPMLATLPPFSSSGLSWMLRALLLSMVCLSITPLIGSQVSIQTPHTLAIGVGVLVCEFLFGAALALSIHMFLGAFQTVASTLGALAGFEMDDQTDSAGIGNLIQRIFAWTAGALFVLSGGHRWALQLVFASLEQLPLGFSFDVSDWLYEVPARFGNSLAIALRLALPAALVFFAIGIARSWISRGLSAWDRLAVAGPLHTLGLVWGLLLSLSSMGWLYQAEIANWMDQTHRSLLDPQRWSSSSETQVAGEDG